MMLELQGVETFYGNSQALFGVDLAVGAGEFVTLLGRNGMGKTTTVRSIMGLNPARSGRIRFSGREIQHWRSYRIGQAGIGFVPEGRQVFPTLTVLENLVATENPRSSPRWTQHRIFELFPRLGERRNQFARSLSGGEQQMLAIGRALLTNPELLILDEATEGLAPIVRADIWAVLAHLKSQRQAVLVIDKNIGVLLRLADRHFIMEKGRTVWSGTSAELAAMPELRTRYLGV